jgi:hypothetical protein
LNPVEACHSVYESLVLILSSHLLIGPASDLLHSDVQTETLREFLTSPMHSTQPANPIVFILPS